MKLGFFTNLPPEMITDILARLPARTIMSCKCICKPWLHLLQTNEFAKSHLSKPTSGLAINGENSYKIYEFDDALDLESHENHYIPVIEFKSTDYGLSDDGAILGSANGFLLLYTMCIRAPDKLYVVNPLINECISISCGQDFIRRDDDIVVYGFGASKITDQLKVVRISLACIRDQETDEILSIPKSDCCVYTLGTGSWRSITCTPAAPLMEYDYCSFAALMKGNLHWLVFDLNGFPCISCFDLEDEQFSTFSAPPAALSDHRRVFPGLHAMENGLCVSDNASDDMFVGWILKDYGDDKSWSKEFVINKLHIPNFFVPGNDLVCPIKVFKDGDILLTWDQMIFFYYSGKTKSTHEIGMFDRNMTGNPILHTSSFRSLKGFVKENVSYRNM